MAHAQDLAPREHQNVPSIRQVRADLPGQLTENSLDSVAKNGSPEPFAHHDPDLSLGRREAVRDQIEERSLRPTAVLLDPFNIDAATKEEETIGRRSAHALTTQSTSRDLWPAVG